ncbi:MAG: hypothetical protein RhofKO_28500 [Rhodothermales bacterium]
MFGLSKKSSDRDPYLNHAKGIQAYSENLMSELIFDVKKKIATLRERSEALFVEQANLKYRLERLEALPALAERSFFSIRQRLLYSRVMIGVVMLTSIVLHVAAMINFAALRGTENIIPFTGAGVLLALVLTGGGMMITARWIRALMLRKRNARDTPDESDDVSGMEDEQRVGWKSNVTIWTTLFILFQVTLVCISVLEAKLVSASATDPFFWGFLTLSVLLPSFAGLLIWDSSKYIDAYRVRRATNQIKDRLVQIDAMFREDAHQERDVLLNRSITAWRDLNQFKIDRASKSDQYAVEDEALQHHFSHSYDAFISEAHRRLSSVSLPDYEPIRDVEDRANDPLSQDNLEIQVNTQTFTGDGSREAQAKALRKARAPKSQEA